MPKAKAKKKKEPRLTKEQMKKPSNRLKAVNRSHQALRQLQPQ